MYDTVIDTVCNNENISFWEEIDVLIQRVFISKLQIDNFFDIAKDSDWNSSGWNSTGSNWSSNASSTPKKAVDVKLFEVENNILDDYIELFVSKPNFLVKAFLCYDL